MNSARGGAPDPVKWASTLRTRLPGRPQPALGESAGDLTRTSSFGEVVRLRAASGDLVVQPRMGFADPQQMRAGLIATKHAAATTVGTLTLDSYTRLGDHTAARKAYEQGLDLNGYPIIAHGRTVTRAVLDGVQDAGFPVQIRHGSPNPRGIIAAMVAVGLDATEGGPVSYCLPYSRTPLSQAVSNWADSCELLAQLRDRDSEPHLETFGGCLMGQLCPPGLLVAMSVLEGLFFRQHGLHSISLSYAQQTNPEQDEEAIRALRRLAGEFLPELDWHVVLYAYMGAYPRTLDGAMRLLGEAAALAAKTGTERLIVKTAAEAYRLPNIEENVAALEHAARAARCGDHDVGTVPDTGLYAEARALVEAVLDLHEDVRQGLVRAFARGHLDVPYCLHPDNAGRSRGYIDSAGWLRWSQTGSMPIRPSASPGKMTSGSFLSALSYIERKFDEAKLEYDTPGVKHVPADTLPHQ